jgi:hypothetical protein
LEARRDPGKAGSATNILLSVIGLDQDNGGCSRSRTVNQLERQLDAARLALVALLAVITDEQLRSAIAALEAIHSLSETSEAALEELSNARVADDHRPERDR